MGGNRESSVPHWRALLSNPTKGLVAGSILHIQCQSVSQKRENNEGVGDTSNNVLISQPRSSAHTPNSLFPSPARHLP